MQQNANVTIDTDHDDDDDDDNVKQEVTQTIEKFVQNRHVQTLKYLQHVIDENRHLRLHIEHLKRRHDDPTASPAIIDRIDSEERPISEISLDRQSSQTIEFEHEHEHCDRSTNTDGDDFEMKCHLLNDEIMNLKKQHQINRDEYQRELERVDQRNAMLEKDLRTSQQQLLAVQKQYNEKQIELRNLNSSLDEMKTTNETLANQMERIEEKNRLVLESLTVSEQIRIEFESQLNELKLKYDEIERKYSRLQIEHDKQQQLVERTSNEIHLLEERIQIERQQTREYKQKTIELRETVNNIREELQERVIQEEKYQQEKQMNSNFKEFIQVKRNLQACQQENEQLKIELKKLQVKLINIQ